MRYAGLEERVAAEKHKHNTLQHQLADAQRAHLERNKENERAACAAALTQEAIAECLARCPVPCVVLHSVQRHH